MKPEAKTWYEQTRGFQEFVVTGFTHKAANQFATWYEFSDGSRLTLFRRGAIQWGQGWADLSPENPYRLPMAIRTLGI